MLSLKKHNSTITHLSPVEHHKFINSEATLLLWQSLRNNGALNAQNKFKEALQTYQLLCEEYSINPRVK